MSMNVFNRFLSILNEHSIFFTENCASSCAVNQNESNDRDIQELDRFEPMTPVTDAK